MMGKICDERKYRPTYKNQRSVEVLLILLDVVGVVLCCLLLVHGVEVKAGVVVLYGLQKCPKSILYAMFTV